MSKYYVYIFKHKDMPFYVGKGTSNRMYRHRQDAIKKKINSPLHNKIRKIIEANEDIEYEKRFLTDNPEEAYAIEKQLIKEIGRKDLGLGPLCNLTDGGEGVVNSVWTDERKKRHSKNLTKAFKNRKKPVGFRGPHPEVSDETRKKLSESGKAYNNSPAGIEKRKRLSKERKGKPRILSEEARQKMRDAAYRTNKMHKEKRKTESWLLCEHI